MKRQTLQRRRTRTVRTVLSRLARMGHGERPMRAGSTSCGTSHAGSDFEAASIRTSGVVFSEAAIPTVRAPKVQLRRFAPLLSPWRSRVSGPRTPPPFPSHRPCANSAGAAVLATSWFVVDPGA